jgi:hypothetical protein
MAAMARQWPFCKRAGAKRYGFSKCFPLAFCLSMAASVAACKGVAARLASRPPPPPPSFSFSAAGVAHRFAPLDRVLCSIVLLDFELNHCKAVIDDNVFHCSCSVCCLCRKDPTERRLRRLRLPAPVRRSGVAPLLHWFRKVTCTRHLHCCIRFGVVLCGRAQRTPS